MEQMGDQRVIVDGLLTTCESQVPMVTVADFDMARQRIVGSMTRNLSVSSPQTPWNAVGGLVTDLSHTTSRHDPIIYETCFDPAPK